MLTSAASSAAASGKAAARFDAMPAIARNSSKLSLLVARVRRRSAPRGSVCWPSTASGSLVSSRSRRESARHEQPTRTSGGTVKPTPGPPAVRSILLNDDGRVYGREREGPAGQDIRVSRTIKKKKQ